MYTHTHACLHTSTHTHNLAHTHPHARTQTHTNTHTYTHACTYTHTTHSTHMFGAVVVACKPVRVTRCAGLPVVFCRRCYMVGALLHLLNGGACTYTVVILVNGRSISSVFAWHMRELTFIYIYMHSHSLHVLFSRDEMVVSISLRACTTESTCHR